MCIRDSFIFAFRAIGVAYYWIVVEVNDLGEECSILWGKGCWLDWLSEFQINLRDGEEPRWCFRENGRGTGRERSGPWLYGGCVVCGRSWGTDGFDATVDRKLAVSDIRWNFRGGMPVSAHRFISGIVRKTPVGFHKRNIKQFVTCRAKRLVPIYTSLQFIGS